MDQQWTSGSHVCAWPVKWHLGHYMYVNQGSFILATEPRRAGHAVLELPGLVLLVPSQQKCFLVSLQLLGVLLGLGDINRSW